MRAVAGLLCYPGADQGRGQRPGYGDAVVHLPGVAGRGLRGPGARAGSSTLGDYGLGVFHNLEGVLLLSSGSVFRAAADGTLRAVGEGEVTAFATCCFLQPDVAFDSGAMPLAVFEKTMDWKRKGSLRLVHAYRITGTFASVRIKSTAKSRRPCPPWEQAWAEAKASTASNLSGTVMGFWFPDSLDKLTGVGYRLGFVDDQHRFGGWVEDFQLARGRIEIDLLPPPFAQY